jgi:exosortase
MQEPNAAAANLAQSKGRQRIAVALKLAAITIAIITLYAQDLNIVFRGALTDEATFHILAIPFLFTYLLYRRRKMIKATLQETTQTSRDVFKKHFTTIAGTLTCTIAVLIYWYGSYTFTPLEYHMITLPVMTTGLTLILFNTKTLKQLIFPIAFLFFLTPPPAEFLYSVGSALSNIAATASNGLVNLLGMTATLSDNYGSPLITLTSPQHGTMNFSVDVACSGIYSIIGFTIFALFIAYISRGKLHHKLALLIMGIPLIIVLNIIRISTVLAIGYNWGNELALEIFHTIGATVLMFAGTLILLGINEKAFKKPPQTPPCIACASTPQNPTKTLCANCGKLLQYPSMKLDKFDLAKIAAIIVAVVMLLSIQAPVFALTQGPAQVLIETPSGPQVNTSTAFLPNMTNYQLNYVYRDTAFEQISHQEASLIYAYSSLNKSKQTVWVGIEIAEGLSALHRWETCLINYPLSQGQQATVNQIDLRDIQLQENPPIAGRYFAFQYKTTNQTQAVLYWYTTATFNVNGTTQTKNIKMSLITYPATPADVPAAEEYMLHFAVAINEYWQPIKTWTPIALAISQNGLTLAAATIAALTALIVYMLYLGNQEKSALLTLYRKLPTANQQLLTAVINANKNQQPTTKGITAELQKITGTETSEEQIEQKLTEAENNGLITKELRNQDDNPIYTWKNQINPNQQKPPFGIPLNFFRQ